MNPLQSWLRTIGVLAICGCACFCLWRVSVAADAVRLPNVQPTLDRANATLDAINAPCTGFHGSVTCGPLAQLSQTAKNVGIVAGQSALQVKQSGKLIDAAATAVQEVSQHASRTADAATGTLTAATETLGEGKRTIAAAQPLLEAYTRTGNDLDAMIQENSPSVRRVLVNAADMTASGNGILYDAKLMADKTREDYLRPQTPWMKIGHALWNGYDLAAFAARHTP